MKCEVIKRNMYVLMVLVLLFGLLLYFGTAPMASAADPEGWVLQHDVGGFMDLSAVDANTAWAVEGAGAWPSGGDPILKTTDGVNWVEVYSNPSHWFCGISAVDANTAWAVGGGGLILKTINGGETWDPQTSGISTTLRGVSAVNADTAWAVGQNRRILNTTDGGVTWEVQYSSGTSEGFLYGVSAADAKNVWAVGYDRILNTTDGGETWDQQATRAGWGVSAVDANTAWASGTWNILRTTNGGEDWVEKDLGTPVSLCGVSAVDANTAWTVGQDQLSGGGIIHKTTDGGESWVEQYSGPPGYWLIGVSALDATTAWAGGWNGILGTHDGGDERPDIASIAPSSGRIGNEVTISGCDFGSSQGSSSVSFGAAQATGYNSWSDTQIKVLVPRISQGLYQVTVTTPDGISNGVSFTRKPPVSGCGTGGGMAVAMLGLTLGLLSVAGSLRVRKRLLTRLQQVR